MILLDISYHKQLPSFQKKNVHCIILVLKGYNYLRVDKSRNGSDLILWLSSETALEQMIKNTKIWMIKF